MQEPDNRKQPRKLTPKELAYLKARASGNTKRASVAMAYDNGDRLAKKTLDNMAQRIEKRPEVVALLQQFEHEAQQSVIDTVRYSREFGRSGTKEGAQYARVAIDGANSILDRVHGKARQQIDMQVNSVAISIDLSNDDDIIDVE